jgi:ParB family chromosome partitioning protein
VSAKKSGLGRGFESLMPAELFDESFDPTADQDGQVSDLRHVVIDELHADPDQPRRTFNPDELKELAASLTQHGVIQPLIVTPSKTGGYMIVAGERRYRAAQLAKLHKLPVLVRSLSAQHKLEVSLIENLQRTDLNAIETATAYAKLRDQFNLTMEEIGVRVGGRSTSAVTNTLRLLRLPADVKKAIAEGTVTEGQVRPLINLTTEQIAMVFPRIVAGGWSARKVEQEVARMKNHSQTTRKPVQQEREYVDIAGRLEQRLAAPVAITKSARGGKITISFRNKNELDALYSRLSQ